jgi:rhamnose utilization protein RhaD (predicted bifunctional aldolase and dehydrogenase)
MVGELATHTLRAGAPAPSVETLLHAILPQAYVDHTHADAVLSISNSPAGEERIREIYGDRVVVIPYIMAGFDLASFCAREFPRQASERTVGMVLLSHGVFSFGADARESYEQMVRLVSMAEEYLASRKAWSVALPPEPSKPVRREEIARLRRDIADAAGFPLILRIAEAPKFAAFARHPDVARLSQQAPATPDHVLRTKPLPMIGRDVAAFAERYRGYFERCASGAKTPKTMVDPAPRMVLDPEFGFAAAGRTARDAAIVEELYDHTIDVILRAEGPRRLARARRAACVRHRVLGPGTGEAQEGRRRSGICR